MEKLYDVISENLKKVFGRPSTVIVFLNPIGGSANAQSIYKHDVEPILKMADIKCELKVSEKADHFKELVKTVDFRPYDAIVIIGGDGTFNEVIGGLIQKTQTESGVNCHDQAAQLKAVDIPVAFIPAGTGNGMASVAHGCVDVRTSTLHILKGQTKKLPVFGNFCSSVLVGYSFLMTAYGMFAELMYYVDYHRWMKKLRYVFLPAWFLFFKTFRQVDAEVTYEVFEDDVAKLQDETVSKTVTKMMTITSIFALTSRSKGIFDDCSFEEIKSNDYAVVMTYKPTRRQKMISHFAKFRNKFSKKAIDALDFASLHPIQSMKVKIPNSESDMDLIVNMDGEIFKLPHPEIYIKYMPGMYRLFSSFEHQEAPREGD